jgi:hypothetical protein
VVINRLRGAVADFRSRYREDLGRLQVQVGQLQSARVRTLDITNPRDAEFQVFSQFGEDGIIQYLVHRVLIERDIFVEFGVEDYSESNTRFLLVNDNWRGLIIDGETDHVEFVKRIGLDWRYQLDVKTAFVDRENINRLIQESGITGDIGLLSIDIDGNDYWVLEAIDVISPRILVVEYNSTFGVEAAVTIPYDKDFRRDQAHYSHLYWGASLPAITSLAERKGYALVGGNSAGNNAFFVRTDVLGTLAPSSVAEAFAPSRFRESRDPTGALTYVDDPIERLQLIATLPLWDIESSRLMTVAERFGL